MRELQYYPICSRDALGKFSNGIGLTCGHSVPNLGSVRSLFVFFVARSSPIILLVQTLVNLDPISRPR